MKGSGHNYCVVIIIFPSEYTQAFVYVIGLSSYNFKYKHSTGKSIFKEAHKRGLPLKSSNNFISMSEF